MNISLIVSIVRKGWGSTVMQASVKEEPAVSRPDDVKIKIWQVGICGTDREQAEGGRADAPKGQAHLVIGHEMFGQVVEVGSEVTSVQVGDYGVLTVRRGCGQCKACINDRSDMCYTGNYTERGIKGAHGFQSEFVVDNEKYLIKVPEEIKEVGVLTEPMSVAAKAIDEAMIMQAARLKDFDSFLPSRRFFLLLLSYLQRGHNRQMVGSKSFLQRVMFPCLPLAVGGK